MKIIPLKTIVEVVDGRIVKGTEAFSVHDVITGKSRIHRGALFFDIYRDRVADPGWFNQHDPSALITERPECFDGLGRHITLISVPRIKEAYFKFIDFYRALFDIPVIGVTGTCGKTTTKEMIKYVLSGTYQVVATYKSYNALFRNLGYLLDIEEDTQVAVFEMGVAFPGDLKKSCRYFKPNVGVITNIGIDHLQGFGSLNSYVKAKAELLEGMGFDGTLILNADDQNIQSIDLTDFQGTVRTFGWGKRSDYRLTGFSHLENAIRFQLRHRGRYYDLSIRGHAEFNLYNAAAAVAAAHAGGLEIEEATDRLAAFQNVEKHFEFRDGMNGSTVIDDTWSTNPTSIEAALNLLKSLADGRKTTAVLGKMSLLGRHSAKYHLIAGEKVADLGIDQLIVMGSGAEAIGHGALQKGMSREQVFFCRNSDETYEVLKHSLDKHTIALVKTSMLATYKDLMDKIIVKT